MEASLMTRAWRLMLEPSLRGRIFFGALSAFLIAMCGPIGMVLVEALQVAPLPRFLSFPSRFLLFLYFFVPLFWLTAGFAAPIFTITALFVKRLRRFAPLAAFVWFVSWASIPLARPLTSLRNLGLEHITVKAQPLIEAIETYHDETGEYPSDLPALVPKYINRVPSTGAVGYPDFRYDRAKADSSFETYEMRVQTPGGGINFDVFVYWPERNYPDRMYGGAVESINDWAYVHE